jgi:uncharacterized 2Fe-2S/4Fe-4S cluster protein (DUF4445 family)
MSVPGGSSLSRSPEPAFEKEFMQAMHIPHMKEKFPNLKKMLEEQNAPVAAGIKG